MKLSCVVTSRLSSIACIFSSDEFIVTRYSTSRAASLTVTLIFRSPIICTMALSICAGNEHWVKSFCWLLIVLMN